VISPDWGDAPTPIWTEDSNAVSRHLMEPDPDTALPSLGFLLWLCVFLLGGLVILLHLAT
jgi:hypothetical protein